LHNIALKVAFCCFSKLYQKKCKKSINSQGFMSGLGKKKEERKKEKKEG
jgi:hypothetical protein